MLLSSSHKSKTVLSKYFVTNTRFTLHLFFKQTRCVLELMGVIYQNQEFQAGHLPTIIQLILCYLLTVDHADDLRPKKLSWRWHPKLFDTLFFIICSLLPFEWAVNFVNLLAIAILDRLILPRRNHNLTILWDFSRE